MNIQSYRIDKWLVYLSHSYILNTCVDPPHDQAVTSVTFQNQRTHTIKTYRSRSFQGNDDITNELSNQIPLLVSTSLDGRFKTWVLVDWEEEEEGEGKGGVVPSWACRSVGYYHSLACLGSAFCEDGSLLALNFKKVCTHAYTSHMHSHTRIHLTHALTHTHSHTNTHTCTHLKCTSKFI